MGEIKAVTFDVGGVLARGGLKQRLYRSEVLKYFKSLGLEVGPEAYRRATSAALQELRRIRERGLELKFEEFCSKVLEGVGVAPTEAILEGIKEIYFRCFTQVERAGAAEVLAELSKTYSLGVVSNSMSLAPKRFLEQSGLAKYFRAVVVSGEVGYRKPYPEIFKRALGELGAEPDEAIHVGNSLDEDVAGAKGAGMHSVLIAARVSEEAEVEPDLAVPSIRDVPFAIEVLANPKLWEFKELLGGRCILCSASQVCLYKLDEKGGEEVENYVLLCPGCRMETLRKLVPRPRKRGKYRAIYRRAWLETRAALVRRGK